MIVSVVSIYDTCLGDQCLSAGLSPFCLVFCRLVVVVSHVFSTQDGDRCLHTVTTVVYRFYTGLTCVDVEPAQPTPSTALTLQCETHPA